MARQLSVSVLVPCFNAGRWLVECIESVRQQSFPPLETVIVDDGSDDADTLEILNTYESVQAINVLHKSNGGVASARNAALEAAKGDYVLFLDSDDYLEPNALTVMAAAAEKTGAGFVGAGWRDVDEVGRSLRTVVPGTVSEDYYAAAVNNGMATGGVLNKRRLDVRFNDTMPWEVMEYFLDCLSLGEKVVFLDDVVVNRRQSTRPERLTNKLDHFEPMSMGLFFAERKNKLLAVGAASDERLAALDYRIISCVHGLLYANRYVDAEALARNVRPSRSSTHAKNRLGSFAWCFKVGGIKAARYFVTINRLVGR
jgi:glycosyltransferase involved in cell wall biosynthesis